jgi:hypothetical protein
MNKCLIRCATITLCVINAMSFSYGEKTSLGLNQNLRKASNLFSPRERNAAKVIGGIALSAAARTAYTRCADGKNFYNGKYAKGFYMALQLSGACFTFAPMLNDQYSSQLFRYGVRAPIAATIAIGVAHPNSQKLIYNAPFIGEYLSNHKEQNGQLVSQCGSHCQGICLDCYVTKSLAMLGIYMVFDPIVDKIGTYIGEKFGIINKDEKPE